MYALIRPLLFLFDPEGVHHFTFSLLRMVGRVPGFQWIEKRLFHFEHPALEKQVLGINFKNPVGLAAGFDKDARLIDELSCLGFGFIEIGTLTPQPQTGNARPRLFRLPQDKAIINRMGFNNLGVMAAVQQLAKRKSKVIVGGNIGKNKWTANEKAFEDYNYCIDSLYPYVDYFVLNVSSPNTPDLRALQEKEPLKKLLTHVRELIQEKETPKPVLLKIAPDLSEAQLDDVVEILRETKTDGVIATNTTTARNGLATPASEVEKAGQGGLSGKPLGKKSTEIIGYLRNKLGPGYPIIGSGGMMTPEDAMEKIKAGADLIQVYTGFVYAGPAFVKNINKRILKSSLKDAHV